MRAIAKRKKFTTGKIAAAVLFLLLLLTLLLSLAACAGKDDSASVLEGDGTFASPYLIRTADDLIAFSEDVNGGNSYAGLYVKQVADIDMGNQNFCPIGVYGGGNYFEGTYLGGGHTISNFTTYGIHGDSANNGLFGLLLGKVYSLGIESGEIEGSCIGSIASHTAGAGAMIVNCYSKAYVHGTRTGGIADNFAGGSILNCWSLCYNEEGEYIPLCSYSADLIAYCYSAGDIIGDDETLYEQLKQNRGGAYPLLTTSFVAGELNNANLVLHQYRCLTAALTNYDEEADGLCFIADEETGNAYFDGRGTKYSPYKIKNSADLTDLSIFVETGESFKDNYLKQTADIDMADVLFLPIGIYGEGNYFYGTYDGSGYSILNLYIDTERGGRNNALFGTLGGSLRNLNLDGSCYIEGNCCASFASHAAAYDAQIVNCSSSAYVYGRRSGGIADNFMGYIIGCWYQSDEESLPIVSYDALSVQYSYCNYSTYLPKSFTGEDHSNFYMDNPLFKGESLVDLINANLAFVASQAGVGLSELTKCGEPNIYSNAFENWFIHPLEMLKAYRYHLLAIVVIAGSGCLIFFTLKKQRKEAAV